MLSGQTGSRKTEQGSIPPKNNVHSKKTNMHICAWITWYPECLIRHSMSLLFFSKWRASRFSSSESCMKAVYGSIRRLYWLFDLTNSEEIHRTLEKNSKNNKTDNKMSFWIIFYMLRSIQHEKQLNQDRPSYSYP